MAAPTLEVVAGPAAGRRLELGDGFVIGRHEQGSGALGGDPELSRRHAQLSLLPDGRVLVEDLGSTNGTWVNGSRIPAPTLLAPGDQLALGGSVLQVLSPGPSQAPVAGQPAAAPPKEKRPGLRVV